jgi:hypothetical protein
MKMHTTSLLAQSVERIFMPKINMPAADWDTVLHVLTASPLPDYVIHPIIKDINKQLNEQEH